MQALGAPADQIAQARAQLPAHAPAAFEVHPDNWAVVLAFCALAPRWQHASMAGQRTGLDWAGVEAWIDRHIRRRQRRTLSAALQTMERAVLHADAEQPQE
jgi:hypothetical protein